MEYIEYTKEEIDFSDKIFKEQEKIIESSNDLNFLHAKAEEIFYDDRYTEGDWDSIFASVIWKIEKQHNPASLPVLLRLCDDARFEVSLFQESWREVFNSFSIGDQEEYFISEYFKNLHELFPQASGMAAMIYAYSIGGGDINRQEKYVMQTHPGVLDMLYKELLGADYPFVSEAVDFHIRSIKHLKKYYNQHRMRLVE
jgi:hypothetical protein